VTVAMLFAFHILSYLILKICYITFQGPTLMALLLFHLILSVQLPDWCHEMYVSVILPVKWYSQDLLLFCARVDS